MSERQYLRKATLVLVEGDKALDLSEFHFQFNTVQQDVESPNNCTIRVYNLSESTVRQVRGEFSRVILQAGYDGNYGVIFDGTIRQFRIGRVNATDKYLDILAADGDLAYNWGVVRKTVAAGSTPDSRIKAAIDAMAPHGVTAGYLMPFTGGVLPRGKVLFGMARAVLREEAENQLATWDISGGKVNFVAREHYLPGITVKLNALTGMVGRPEQTNEGIRVKSLLNPRVRLGGLLEINNASINQTVNQNPNAPPGPAFNQYSGVQLLATVTNDGLYRVFVIEHDGDTRGTAWHTNMVCLAVDTDSKKVRAP